MTIATATSPAILSKISTAAATINQISPSPAIVGYRLSLGWQHSGKLQGQATRRQANSDTKLVSPKNLHLARRQVFPITPLVGGGAAAKKLIKVEIIGKILLVLRNSVWRKRI